MIIWVYIIDLYGSYHMVHVTWTIWYGPYQMNHIVWHIHRPFVTYAKTNIRKNKKLKQSKSNSYIKHLAITDLMFVLTLPIWAVDYFTRHKWYFGLIPCKAVRTISKINMYRYVWPIYYNNIRIYFIVYYYRAYVMTYLNAAIKIRLICPRFCYSENPLI